MGTRLAHTPRSRCHPQMGRRHRLARATPHKPPPKHLGLTLHQLFLSFNPDFVSADSVLITRQHLLDPSLEHTLILVKPDGYARGLTGEILRRIEAKGYIIKGLKIMVASREILAEHYRDHAGKPFFEGLLDFMSAGPLVAIIVEGQRVIEGMRTMMGSTDPTTAPAGTIRGDLGRAWDTPNMENIIHGSDCAESALREIQIWFPEID